MEMHHHHLAVLLTVVSVVMSSVIGASISSPSYTETSTPPDGGNIIGGNVAKPGSTPWLVSIRDPHYDPPAHFCGGTVMNHYWILTSACCVISYYPHELLVVLGEYDQDIDEGYEVYRHPILSFIHPLYDYFEFSPEYNVALLLLPPFPYNERIQPAHLMHPSHHPLSQYPLTTTQQSKHHSCHGDKFHRDLEGEDGLIAGWGKTGEVQTSHLVIEANLTVLSNDICVEAFPEYDMESLMCAANVTYGGTGACSGDQGGGLINKDGYILGVYSYLEPCTEYPGVFVNILKVQDWLCPFFDPWDC